MGACIWFYDKNLFLYGFFYYICVNPDIWRNIQNLALWLSRSFKLWMQPLLNRANAATYPKQIFA